MRTVSRPCGLVNLFWPAILFSCFALSGFAMAEGESMFLTTTEVARPEARPPRVAVARRIGDAAPRKRSESKQKYGNRTGAEYADFILRVNIIQSHTRISQPSLGPAPTVVNGAIMDNFMPLFEEVYPTTGLVLDEKGHLLVYVGERWMALRHPSTRIEVTTPDGQVAHAILVGTDERIGLAVMKCADLKAKPSPIDVGKSFRAGTPVKKIELWRRSQIHVLRAYVEHWEPQGEAIISIEKPQGRLAGPVLSGDGKVVGIALGQARRSGAAERPQATVIRMAEILTVAEQIIRTGASIPSGWIGVFINDLDPELRRQINAQTKQGILVREVSKGSPAEKAGLQSGDIIQKIAQRVINDSRDFVYQVQNAPAGQTILLHIVRGQISRDIPVLVEKRRPEEYIFIQTPPALEINTPELLVKLRALQSTLQETVAQEKKRRRISELSSEDYRKLVRDFEDRKREIIESQVRLAPARPHSPTMGVFCSELSLQLGQFFGVNDGAGVLVNSVPQSTPAEIAGIKAGDILVKIENAAISHCADLVREVHKRRAGDKIKVTIVRNKKWLPVYVTLDKSVVPVTVQ